ncbi:MAG: DUF1553 domain-containing protein [Fuerstiella sp.]|nr:DUF1553 domain-containing protein [Fuerstiella sp.]MCP4509283.1 DUF1553 domain-containing protein [Fuerstiella sp.]
MKSHILHLLCVLLMPAASMVAAGEVDYLRDVKPLLEHKCYACHGALKQQGGLRLDTAVSLNAGGDSGAALAAGQPNDSLLLDVLTGDAGFRMPPANEGSPMTDREIDLIRSWITEGAHSPAGEQPQTDPKSWWSYQRIQQPSLPDVTEAGWCRNEIDCFVAAAREENDLPHVAETSKAAWLRRVYLDLTGLPPTRQELHQFIATDSPSAFENVVDELLDRPQYGERWGRHWMDVWRYSDWYGSRGINEIRYSQRHIWRWRDWIVKSLNDDKGYDQMIREMLAADEISGGDPAVLPATGYLGRNWYKFDRNVWMFETVERTGEAFLGMTFRCCRCHDHKFDPVSQEEYYRFRAFFEPHDVRTDRISALTTTEKDATLGQVLSDGIALAYDKNPDVPTYRFERGDNRYPDETKLLTPGVPASLGGEVYVSEINLPAETWYPMLRPGVRETMITQAQELVSAAETQLREKQTADKLAGEKLKAAIDTEQATSSEPKTFLHETFSAAAPEVWETVNGAWAYADGKLVQSAVTSFATMVSKETHPRDFDVHLRYRPLSPGTYRSIGFSFDYQDKGQSQDVYTATGDSRQSVQAFHRAGGKQVYPKEGIVTADLNVGEEAVLDVSVQGSKLTIDLNGTRKLDYVMPVERRDGRFALWVHQGTAEFLELKITAQVDSIETLEQRKRDSDHAIQLAQANLHLARGEANSIRLRLAADIAAHLRDDKQSAKDSARTASAAELAVAVLQAEVEVLKAGHSDEKRAAATAKLATAHAAAMNPTEAYTAIGEQFPKTSTGRRSALAEWITRSDNPRTARVAANHLWGRHFGQPLVATPENFGLNGRKPTHPQLLNWLAAQLVHNDWKMKPLHKQIVLSATYRMASTAVFGGVAQKRDSENQFLWRMNSRRMEAEVVRDSTLFLASRLDMTMGGPEIAETDGEKTLRRSLYFRNTPNEKMAMLEVFDVADPNSCYRRKESVVPHQALAMMNSGLTLDSARAIAEQIADEDDFVTAAFETVLSRRPTDEEAVRCRAFLSEHYDVLQDVPAQPFAEGGSAKQDPSTDPGMRARENLVHVLFLHNDFVTIR